MTFAIWGLIYILMGVFILYGWGVFDKWGNSKRIVLKIGPWFAISCAFNIGWIFSWHYDAILLSTVMIVGLLVSLIFITRILGDSELGKADKLCADAGFGIYYGWIIAATIANVAVLLTKAGWNGFGLTPSFWTCIVIAVGALIGTLVAVNDKKYLPTIAVIWAYIGIVIRHTSPEGYAGEYFAVILTVIFSIALMSIGLFTVLISRTESDEKGLLRTTKTE